jgi:hypothetical protein
VKQYDFECFAELFLREAYDTLVMKGRDYAHPDDHFANFREVAAATDTRPEQAWMQGFYKHYARIKTQVRTGTVSSESFEDSVKDAINYLLLLLGEYKTAPIDLGAGREVNSYHVCYPGSDSYTLMNKNGVAVYAKKEDS